MSRHIVAIEVVEKSHEPSNHNFMTAPAFYKCFQQPLALKVKEGGKDALSDVRLKSVAVSNIQLL